MKYTINKRQIKDLFENTYSKVVTPMGAAKQRVLDMHVQKASSKPIVHPNTGGIEQTYNTRARKKMSIEEGLGLAAPLAAGATAATMGYKMLNRKNDTGDNVGIVNKIQQHNSATDDALALLDK